MAASKQEKSNCCHEYHATNPSTSTLSATWARMQRCTRDTRASQLTPLAPGCWHQMGCRTAAA